MYFDTSAFLLGDEAPEAASVRPQVDSTAGLGFSGSKKKASAEARTNDALGQRLDKKRRKAERSKEEASAGGQISLHGILDDEDALVELRRRAVKAVDKPSVSVPSVKTSKTLDIALVAPIRSGPAAVAAPNQQRNESRPESLEKESEGVAGYKRKRPKTRSKQKNIRRDTRDPALRPGYRELTAETRLRMGMSDPSPVEIEQPAVDAPQTRKSKKSKGGRAAAEESVSVAWVVDATPSASALMA